MFEREPKRPEQSKAIKVNTQTHGRDQIPLKGVSILKEQDRGKSLECNNDRPKIRIYIQQMQRCERWNKKI